MPTLILFRHAKAVRASVILRGIRARSGFESELRLARRNLPLAPDMETVFLMPSVTYSYVSSRLVREGARLGGNVEGLVPAAVSAALARRMHPPGSPSR